MPDDTKEADGSVRADLERAFASAAEKAGSDPAEVAAVARTEVDETPADAPASAVDDAAKDPAKATPVDPAKPSRIEPPVRWTKEEKEAWDKMTEGLDEKSAASVQKIQSILVGRNKSMEGEFTRQMQTIAADRAYKSELDKVLGPRREAWSKAGMTDARALGELLDGFEFSNKDPIGFIKWVAGMRNIDLQRAFGGQAQAPPQSQPAAEDDVQLHPAVQRRLDEVTSRNQQLEQHLAAIAQQQQQFGQQFTQQQQREMAGVQQSVATELQAFETATDEAGAPKYPFYNDVRQDMAMLITSGVMTLEDAYDRAVYSNPTIRAKVLENQQIAQRREWETKLAADAKRSRSAGGGIVTGAPSTTTATYQPASTAGSVREALEAALAAQMTGGRI